MRARNHRSTSFRFSLSACSQSKVHSNQSHFLPILPAVPPRTRSDAEASLCLWDARRAISGHGHPVTGQDPRGQAVSPARRLPRLNPMGCLCRTET